MSTDNRDERDLPEGSESPTEGLEPEELPAAVEESPKIDSSSTSDPEKEAEPVPAVLADEEAVSHPRRELKRRRKRRVYVVKWSAALLTAAAIVASYLIFFTTTVPVAQASYDELSLEDPCESFELIGASCAIEFQHSDSVARDGLIYQTPGAGFSLTKPASSTIVYSSGPESSSFPDVIRQNYDEAVKSLYLIGVEVGEVKTVKRDDIGANRIVSASVEAGEEIKSGTKVDFEVSADTVDLPNLDGLTREQAAIDLEELGFEFEIIEAPSSEAAGRVIEQSLEPGEQAKGASITVTVAKAEELKNIKVPNVVGMSEDQAQGIIASAGFTNIAVVKVESSKATSPLVSHVAPGEGRTVRSDSNIVLVISVPEATG